MLLKASAIIGCSIQATDGEIGRISDLLFEDDSWSVRWLVVSTGSWLMGRKVLLPSSQLRPIEEGVWAIPVDLTRDQVKGSPGLDTDQPVSRQMESVVYDSYGWAPYWSACAGAAYVPPPGYSGLGVAHPLAGVSPGAAPAMMPAGVPASGTPPQSEGDPHLRSAKEVTDYAVQGTDSRVGDIVDILVDGQEWAIRHLVVDAGGWWTGRRVLISTAWVGTVDWATRVVQVARTRKELEAVPQRAPTQ